MPTLAVQHGTPLLLRMYLPTPRMSCVLKKPSGLLANPVIRLCLKVKSLVLQLRSVGVTIEPNKVANRILNDLDSAHDSMKYIIIAVQWLLPYLFARLCQARGLGAETRGPDLAQLHPAIQACTNRGPRRQVA